MISATELKRLASKEHMTEFAIAILMYGPLNFNINKLIKYEVKSDNEGHTRKRERLNARVHTPNQGSLKGCKG